MKAAWLVGALVLLGAAVWLLWPDEPAPADQAIHGVEAPAAETARTGPTLRVSPAAEAAQAETAAAAPGEVPLHPPFEFVVTSAITEAPLADVEITDDEDKALGATDENGCFRLEQPTESEFVFRAWKESFVRHRGIARAGRETRVVLSPGVEIRGRVVRFEGGAPVPNASVSVFDEDRRMEVASPVTDEEGRFVVRAVRPHHPLTFVVAAPGFVPLVRRENFERALEDFEIRVGEGAKFIVEVRDAKAALAPQVQVFLGPPGWPAPGFGPGEVPKTETKWWPELVTATITSQHTDDKGTCTFEGVPVNQVVQAVALVDRRVVDRGSAHAIVSPQQTIRERLRLPVTASLSLKVQDEQGAPISGGELTLRSAEGPVPIFPGDGRGTGAWQFDALTPGSYVARWNAEGTPTRAKQIRLKAGQASEEILEVPRGRALLGTVVDKQGQPIWRAEVHWKGRNPYEGAVAITDSRGRFKLTRLLAGAGDLVVRAVDIPTTRYAYEIVKIEALIPGGARQEIVLPDAPRITAEFRDLKKGTAVYGDMLPGTKRDPERLHFDEAFRFTRRGPQPQMRWPTTFVFRTRGFPPLIVEEKLPFAPEEVRDLGVLWFEESNPRKGIVLTRDGGPLRGARVEIAEDWSNRAMRTGKDGTFVFPRLPEGEVRIRVTAEGYLPQDATLIERSEYTPHVVRMTRAAYLRGMVVDQRGKPAANGAILIQPIVSKKGAKLATTARTSMFGTFEVGVLPGYYYVTAVDAADPRRARQYAEEKVYVGLEKPGVLNLRLRWGRPPRRK